MGCTLRGARDKGRAVLLDVLDRLSEVPGLSLTLLLGGQEEVPLPWAHRADTRVLRTPLHRAEIAAALAACDIYVDASLHEGFGLMPLEAMAAGAAVVASDSGGVREYLRDGETGVLVGAVNHAGPYVDAVTRLATDAGRRRTLRAAGLAEAARFAPERSVSAWREALNAVLTQVPKVEAPRALPATPSWLVRPAGAVPRIVLRDVRGPQPGGTRLRLEVTSPSGVRLVAAGRFGALGRRGPNGTLAAVRARGFEVLDRLRVFTQAPAEVDEEVAPGRVSVTLDVPPLLPGEELVLAFPALAAELELSALCLDLPQANGPELLRRVSALRESVLSTGVSLELPAAPGRSRVVRCSLETRGAAEALGRFHGAGAFSAGWETAPAVGTRSLWRHVPEEALRAWIGAASPPERIDCDLLILDRPARWSQVAPSP
ncbi:MAG: glycosyltransferase [Deltaproteobacteria bacterium]|nr:glycosyltransferase [Deltaproteobacteria bacterium]